MNHTTKNIGIILAGGGGSRMGLGYPKQFSKIAGKTVLEHTIEIFQNHHLIDEIIIVSEQNSYNRIEELVAKNSFSKVGRIVFGGQERSDSTLSAIKSLEQEPHNPNLIIHDAARPLLSSEVITSCIQKLEKYNAVDVVIPATDTIVHVDNNTQEILDIPKRDEYYQGQTPQAFKRNTLQEAYRIYQQGGIQGTCDCGILLKTLPNEKIGIVLGSPTNIKLTRPLDLFLADKLFQSRSHFSLNNIPPHNTFHTLKGKVLVVIGGSYGIGSEIIDIARQLGANTYSLSRSNGVNVADIQSVQQGLANIYEQTNRIDYVVNTAAILNHKALALMSYEEILESVNVNYLGAVNVAITAYPYLKAVGGGLLNFTSSSYTRGRPFYSIYSSTKSAIVNLTQALSEEWSADHVKINCINPERTKTPMRTNAFGVEPEGTLLNPKTVALVSLITLISNNSGDIIDVTLKDEERITLLLTTLSLG